MNSALVVTVVVNWNQVEETEMAKDYYVVLGVGPDATLDQIKSAYRRKAKRWHPEHSREGSGPFRAIQEAYEVLGDPARRRAYEEELSREKKRARAAARRARPEPLRRRRCPVEPLVPTQRSGGARDPFFELSFPSLVEELYRRPWGDLDAPLRSRTGRGGEEVHLQVSLSREEALHGGRIRLSVLVRVRCPACRGRGGGGFFECFHCFGSGAVVDEYPMDVAFPGGLVDGARGSLSLGRLGMRDLSLVLHFRVDPW